MSVRPLDPQAVQLLRAARAEHRTGLIVRAGRPPIPSWARPVRLGRMEADRAVDRYLEQHPEARGPAGFTARGGSAIWITPGTATPREIRGTWGLHGWRHITTDLAGRMLFSNA